MLLRRPSPCTHIFDPAFSPLGLCFKCRGVVLLRALRGGDLSCGTVWSGGDGGVTHLHDGRSAFSNLAISTKMVAFG